MLSVGEIELAANRERYYYLLKLAMGRRPTVDVSVQLNALEDACKFFYDSESAVGWVLGTTISLDPNEANNSNAIFISDFRSTDKAIEILLIRGDPTIGTPNYVNVKKREVRPAVSNDPDAVPAVSAHLIIEKAEIAKGGDQGRYRAVLERSSGLGKTMVREFLALLLKSYAEKKPEQFQTSKKPHKKGEKGEIVSYQPTIRLHPQQNASLKNDLENGRIGGFQLMRGVAKFGGPAEQQQIVRTSVRLHATIIPTRDVSKVVTLAKSVVETMVGVEFDAMKLELLDSDESRHFTDLLPMETIESSDMRYCRTMRATEFSKDLEQCYAKFNKEIISNGQKFLLTSRLWL
jgi:hypothetical protein